MDSGKKKVIILVCMMSVICLLMTVGNVDGAQGASLGSARDRRVRGEDTDKTEKAPKKEEPDILNVLDETARRMRLIELLNDAEGAFSRDDLDLAEIAAEKVLVIDPENEAAMKLLSKIEDLKSIEETRAVPASRMRGVRDEITRYSLEMETNKNKARRYINMSREHFANGDYARARKYAMDAQGMDPRNPEVALLIADIDKDEIFGNRQKREKDNLEKVEESSEEVEEEVYTANDEPKSWMRRITDIFQGETYELGDVDGGKVYNIDECVQVALANSPRFEVADMQIKMAEIRLWEARRDIFPTVTGRYEASSGKIGADQLTRHYLGRKYKVELKQNIFDGMEKWFAIRQASTNLEIAKLEKEQMRNEVIDEVKKGYYNLDKAIKAHVIQLEAREVTDRYWDVIRKMNEQEIVAKVEYLEVRGQALQADFQELSAEENVSLAEMILFQAMGTEPMENIKIKPVSSPETPLSIGLKNCYSLALTNDPEFKIKGKTIEYYNFERKMKKARGWPKVDFNGSFGASYENYEPLSISGDYTGDPSGPARSGRRMEAEWYAGIKTSVPMWGNTVEHNYVREVWAPTVSAFRGTQSATNYFAVKFLDDMAYFSNLQESRIGFERAKYEYDKARKDLMVSIKEMYFKYRKSLIQMDIARAQVEHQRDYVAVLKEKQRFGEMEVSRVIEEIVKLTEHEYSYVQADADYYISIAGLNKAIGIPEYFRPDYENTEFIEWKQEQIGSGVPGGMKNTVSTKSKRMEKIRLAEKKRKEKKLHREIE
ncbi:MAG: TolC family protein [Candidatus Omnitrophica bacterium]|nr:TolC family protein [Candidatus Omnitrophota bacterium]MBU1127962.1 TolC family protein [Candidatus Omnitrophota bacterium]MBU1784385.1 TolC family protein [Candidatus Omnitrophota bacterium]MBU1851985.1 TolC family protein [Candidatus Omnitrophota bacterium]